MQLHCQNDGGLWQDLNNLFQSEVDPLRWCPNGRGSVSNHQPHDCLVNRLFRRRSKITSKLRVTGLCVGNSPMTGEFPAQMASYAETVSIWWRHLVYDLCMLFVPCCRDFVTVGFIHVLPSWMRVCGCGINKLIADNIGTFTFSNRHIIVNIDSTNM